MAYTDIREEELKNKIAQNYFWQFDCTKIIGNLDFCVTMHQSKGELFEQESLLWAEAKKGTSDIYNSLVQLILTIGKARTFDKSNPPPFLGAIDSEKIAFVPYSEITEIFYVNDFNWNVAPSNYNTKEFSLIHEKVKSIIEKNALLFYYDKDEKELKNFIKLNFVVGKFGINKIRIDKNNFMIIYNKWLTSVKPFISADWELAKKNNIIDGDFYLADLLSEENTTLKDKLFVLLKKDKYEFARTLMSSGFFTHSTTGFKDNQVTHTQFWNKYERPPKEEYWDYIVSRRDLLVPQDVRERKGSFYTPQIWVELSQKYLADVLGEDWQDEYYIWDCAAGTGNLLNGLTNKYNIWASTLDQQDVEVMKDRIKNGANLFEDHVFQFDFLNDDFTKLPIELQKIINDPEKRKKLVMYINPPYAEAGDAKQRTGTGKNKSKTTTDNKIYHKYRNELGKASNELFTQFLIRIKFEIPSCIVGNFSTMKEITASNFKVFRNNFQAKHLKTFIVNANTFDNVNGKFPIGFSVWNTNESSKFKNIKVEVYNEKQLLLMKKYFYSFDETKGKINDWFRSYRYKTVENIGFLMADAPDFQNNKLVAILNYKGTRHGIFTIISRYNLIPAVIYLAVRNCIENTWINNRDQFLIPYNKWEKDIEFQNNCLTFALFHSKNKIRNTIFTNHWLPFTEDEVNCNKAFESNFMTQYIKGKLKLDDGDNNMFGAEEHRTTPLVFSDEAKSVFDAGRKLWCYYHQQPNINVNASLYDIREHFQGRNAKGKMNNKSTDPIYTKLIGELRDKIKLLAQKIEPKVYEYGFLKE